MKKYALYLLIFIVCILSLPVDIYAAGVKQFSICIKNPNESDKKKQYEGYYIVYDSSSSPLSDLKEKAKKKLLTYDDIINKHLPYPANIAENKKQDYQFIANRITNIECTEDDNGVHGLYYCPNDNSIKGTAISSTYINTNDDSTTYNNISFKSDLTDFNNPKYNITIIDKFGGKLVVRYVPYNKETGKFTNTSDEETTAKSYASTEFLTRKKKTGEDKWYYELKGIPADTAVRLEFFQKIDDTKPCSGFYISYITIVTPSAYDIEVDNPAPEYQVCKDLIAYMGASDLSEENKEMLDNAKKLLIPECYNQGKIKLGELNGLEQSINNKFESLKQMFGDGRDGDFDDASAENTYVCDANYISEPKITLAEMSPNKYWGMICRENYTAQGGKRPDIVKAGDGFSYESNFSVTRTCSIIQLRVPTIKPACNTTITHSCSWTGGEGNDAGPNDNFDDCINECDGGEYTQNCINECYKKVYGNNRKSNIFDDLLSYSKNNTKTQVSFMKSTNTKSFTAPNCGTADECKCKTEHGRNGEYLIYTDPKSGKSDKACFSNWCGEHSGSCFFTVTVTPDNCSYDPAADHQQQVDVVKAELEAFIDKYESEIAVGEYEYKIADSYLVTNDGSNYIYTVNNVSAPKLNVIEEQVNSKDDDDKKTGVCLGDNNIDTDGIQCEDKNKVDYYEYVVSTKNIKVQLPLSYVNKTNGSVVYKTSKNSDKSFSVDSKNNKFVQLSSFDSKNYYDGGRKYYTSIWSDDTNIEPDCDNKKVNKKDNGTYNILVSSKDVGTGKFSSSIKCSYSVWNEYYNSSDALTCVKPGLGYIYRTIDLENMFPNRDARYNWTGTIRDGEADGAAVKESDTKYDDSVDPESLISEIQSKGKSIYDVSSDSSEIDYEFVLTTENIRNIRKYNKNIKDYNKDGENNYLDYNLNCYKNANDKIVCTSRFLNNENWNSGSEANDSFITYSTSGYNITNRKAIAVCNNAINGDSCDNIGN